MIIRHTLESRRFLTLTRVLIWLKHKMRITCGAIIVEDNKFDPASHTQHIKFSVLRNTSPAFTILEAWPDWDIERGSIGWLSCVTVARGGWQPRVQQVLATLLLLWRPSKPHYLQTTSGEQRLQTEQINLHICQIKISTKHINYTLLYKLLLYSRYLYYWPAERVIVKITPIVSCLYLMFNRITLSSISSELIRGQEIALSKYFSSLF